MHGFKELFRSVDMLMVDDVQFIAGKESTQDEFFHTFNALVEHGKQIVISGDRAPGEIDGLEDRIKSRLAWGLVVDLHPTDYELRLGILQSKVEVQSKLHPGIYIDSGILEFLAHRISSNVRVLEGSLTRLYAYASLVGRKVDIDMAQECLADILRISERKVTIDEIIRKVSDHYNLRMSDMISARRSRVIARPRQVAMFLAKTLTSKSLPEIGRRFGGRDHTTVIHAVKKIEDLNGLKIRMPGLGGEVLRKVGAAAVAIPGGEIFSSLKSGAIDATEWVGPWNDLSLAFYQAAKFYYWPGFHEPGAGLATGINLDTWNSFSKSEKSIIRQVLAFENNYTLSEFNHHNSIALDTLVKKHNVQMRTFSPEIMKSLKILSEEVLEDVSTRTNISKKIFLSFKDSIERLKEWSGKSEQAYMKARG